jgi:hypothetical protein
MKQQVLIHTGIPSWEDTVRHYQGKVFKFENAHLKIAQRELEYTNRIQELLKGTEFESIKVWFEAEQVMIDAKSFFDFFDFPEDFEDRKAEEIYLMDVLGYAAKDVVAYEKNLKVLCFARALLPAPTVHENTAYIEAAIHTLLVRSMWEQHNHREEDFYGPEAIKAIKDLIPGCRPAPPPLKLLQHRPDFFIENEHGICPVEFKKGKATQAAIRQVQRYMEVFKGSHGYLIAPSLSESVSVPENITFVAFQPRRKDRDANTQGLTPSLD